MRDPSPFLCKDCKYSYIPWLLYLPHLFDKMLTTSVGSWNYKCSKLSTSRTVQDPVVGPVMIKEKTVSCREARNTYLDGFFDENGQKIEACGPDGKYWAPKYKHDLFKIMKHR